MKINPYTSITSDSISQSQNEKNLLATSFINLLPALNNPLQTITNAMNNQLTFQDNMNAESQVVNVKSGVDFTVILSKMTNRPTHMVPGYASGEVISGHCIKSYITTSKLTCNITFASGNQAGVEVNLMFF